MVKKTKKTAFNDLLKQKYLKNYLFQKAYTLKDLKCEVILMVCDMLMENYLITEDNENNEVLIQDFIPKEKSIVNDTMKNLRNDIQENILTIDKIQNIINNQSKDKNSLIKAGLVNSQQYFYNMCVNKLQQLVISNSQNKNKIEWIPDLLCIYLIQDMKEKNYYFHKFVFLDKYNFDSLFEIYERTNIYLKKKANISILSKEKTIIDNMANISYEMVESLISSKYK